MNVDKARDALKQGYNDILTPAKAIAKFKSKNMEFGDDSQGKVINATNMTDAEIAYQVDPQSEAMRSSQTKLTDALMNSANGVNGFAAICCV